jgi:voltage-gated potassium channel
VVGEPDGEFRMGRAIAVTMLQSSAASIVLLFAYYQAPLDRPLDGTTGWLFVLALLLFSAVTWLQLRGILRSDQPILRAIRALSVELPLLLVVFASTYCTIDGQDPGAFTEPLSRTDGLYFTMTIFSTVGLGDIAPVTELARVLVTIQMLVGVIVVAVLAKLVVGAVQLATARRAQTPGQIDGKRAGLY